MKIADSIPDDVSDEGERLARRLRTPRGNLYARAMADFVVRHDDGKIPAAMNQVVREVGAETEAPTRREADQVLRQVEW